VRRIIPNFTPYGHLKQVPTNFKAAGSSNPCPTKQTLLSTQHEWLSKPGAKTKNLPIPNFGWVLKFKPVEVLRFFNQHGQKSSRVGKIQSFNYRRIGLAFSAGAGVAKWQTHRT
jgi:hypothetical protein